MHDDLVTARTTTDAEEEFRDFAYIVSHDLAGPVRSMVAFSQILKEQIGKTITDDDQLHLDLIVESGQKLSEMIQGLLAFSRLNTVPRVSTVCDLEIVLARCYMEAQPRLDATKGVLNYPRMPEITADPGRMFTLFYALIDNALKFRSEAAPDIRIQVEEKADFWQFRISDNGIGIDPMFYDDVFRPLRKLHTDDAYPGVGMGLTLARKIVIQHGGEIWLEPSGRGSGLTVGFTLSKKP